MAGGLYVLIASASALATGFVGRAKGSSFLIWFLGRRACCPVLGLIAVLSTATSDDRARAPLPALRRGAEDPRPGLHVDCGEDLYLPEVPHGAFTPGADRGSRAGAAPQRSQVRTIAFAKPIP